MAPTGGRPVNIKRSYEAIFDPASEACVTVARDVSCWSVKTGKKLWRSHPLSHPSQIAFSPDGRVVAVKGASGRLVTLDAFDGSVLFDFDNEREGRGSNVAFSQDGDHLVDGSSNGMLTVRSAADGTIVFAQSFGGARPASVHRSSDGAVWLTRHHPMARSQGPTPPPYMLQWTWPFNDCVPVRIPLEARPIVTAADKCARRLAVGGTDAGRTATIDLESRTELWSTSLDSRGQVKSLEWSPDDRLLAVLTYSGVSILDGETGTELCFREFPFPSSVSFSPDGQFIALGSWEAGILALVTDLVPE